jgi:hypothetical protein
MLSVHTWPAWHDIRHPPQLAWSLEISTHFPKQNICPIGHRSPSAFAANWVMQRNRTIANPASKALFLVGHRPLPVRALRASLSPPAGPSSLLLGCAPGFRGTGRVARTRDMAIMVSGATHYKECSINRSRLAAMRP